MRRVILALAFLAGLSFNLEAQVPDSVQRALDRAAPGLVSVKGALRMNRDSIFDVDTIRVQQYAPPAEYAEWWAAVEKCSGLTASAEGWSWIAVPGDGFLVKGRGPFPGYAAVEDHNFLVLRKYVFNESLVKHEMLHAVLWMNGRGDGHPEEFNTCGLQAQ
jgi:hypothetical protein